MMKFASRDVTSLRLDLTMEKKRVFKRRKSSPKFHSKVYSSGEKRKFSLRIQFPFEKHIFLCFPDVSAKEAEKT